MSVEFIPKKQQAMYKTFKKDQKAIISIKWWLLKEHFTKKMTLKQKSILHNVNLSSKITLQPIYCIKPENMYWEIMSIKQGHLSVRNGCVLTFHSFSRWTLSLYIR